MPAKIALALSGMPRIFPISAASWGRIIGRYQPDIYIHTWSESGMEDYIKDSVGWVFKPTAIEVENPIDLDITDFPDRHWPQIDVYKSLSMWYSIKQAHKMVKQSGINYDLIIRGRMDWHIHCLEIATYDGIIVPYDYDKLKLTFTYRNKEIHGFNDHFAYGPSRYMDSYVSTFDEILPLYRDEGVDYCPENFLAANLVKKNVPVMLQQMEHLLIRS